MPEGAQRPSRALDLYGVVVDGVAGAKVEYAVAVVRKHAFDGIDFEWFPVAGEAEEAVRLAEPLRSGGVIADLAVVVDAQLVERPAAVPSAWRGAWRGYSSPPDAGR
jgi:hypothetical protein